MTAAILLAVVAVQVALRLLGRPYLSSRVLPRRARGAARLLIWAARLWLSFALPTFLALALLGRVDALWRMPPEFAPPAESLGGAGSLPGWTPLVGLGLGVLLSAIVNRWRLRRGRGPLQLGRSPTLPERRGELPAAAVLAVSAGVTEELYFRLLVPLLVTLVFGSALAGFGAAAVIFGLQHRYQGIIGMLATGASGLFMGAIYLLGGGLWLPMLFHAGVDLNALVVKPWLTMRAGPISS